MSWFESLVGLVHSVSGAQTTELTVLSRPPLEVRVTSGAVARGSGFSTTSWLEPQVIDPAELHPDLRTMDSWVGSMAVVSIVSPSAEIGWLAVAHEDSRAFDQSTLKLLSQSASLTESYLDDRIASVELDHLSEALRMSERALAETQARLEISNQELEQFAYIAAHEIVAPLRSVAVYAEVLATLADQDCDDSSQLTSCVGEIRTGVQQMTEQVQYLLTLSRANQRVGKLQLVDTTRTAYGAVDTLTEMLEEAEASVDIDPLPAVLAHDIPLQSVFANLITNAVRYRDLSRLLRVRITARIESGKVNIEVADNASGISEEDQRRIFSLFERSSTAGDGLGVGLAVSRRILEGFGASIGVRSSPEGSRFILQFPDPMTIDH